MENKYKMSVDLFNKIYDRYLAGQIFYQDLDKETKLIKVSSGQKDLVDFFENKLKLEKQ
jgi:hypothetical protein